MTRSIAPNEYNKLNFENYTQLIENQEKSIKGKTDKKLAKSIF